MGVPTQLMQDQVTQLYIGFFGRAPDADGFGYWVNGMANGVTQQAIANTFATTPEFIANYSGLQPSQAVTKMYNNILNRAPDAGGLTFWANSIANGQNTLATCVVAILNSCVAQGTGTSDGALVANKTAVGEYFAITLASNDSTVAATAYNTVTSDTASVATAEAALLTSASTQINITSATPGTFTSGAANTTFNALPYFPTGTTTLTNTLVNGDSLVGNANYQNTLNVDLIAGSSVKPTAITNIQNLAITNEGTTTLDLSNANTASAASVALNALNGNMTLANAQNATASYALNNLSTGGLTLTVGTGIASGTNDTVKVTANKVSGTTTYLDLPSAFETLQLTSTTGTTNTIQTNFTGAATASVTGGVTILGSGNLTYLGSAAATVTAINVNASAFTGTFSSTMSDAVTTSISLGSGNDTIKLSGSGATGVTVNLGSGTNYLQMTDLAQVSAESSITGGSGSDTLQLTTVSTSGIAGLKNITGMDVLKLAAGSTTSNVITLGTNFTNAGFTTVTSTGTGDNITVQGIALTGQVFSNTQGTGTGTLALNTASGTVTVTNYGAVSADNGTTAMAITVNGTGNTTVSANKGTQTITLASTALETLTLSGTARFAVTGGSHTGDAVVLGTNTGTTGGATTVTGGSVGMTVDMSNSAAANTIAFTAGTNKVIAGTDFTNVSAASSITGGSGTDTLQITAVVADANADKALYSVKSGFEVLALTGGSTTSNVITLGTNFTNAGFTSVTTTGTGDYITVQGATLTGQTFTGIGTGTGTLALNTASGTVTVTNYGAVSADNGTTAMAITVNGTGNTTVSANKGTQTITLASTALETLTLSGTARFAVTGGSHTGDAVVLGTNTGTTGGATTVTGGSVGMTVDMSNSAAANTIAFTAGTNKVIAGTDFTNVSAASSITGGSGTDTLQITAVVADANADKALYSVKSGFEVLALTGGSTTSNVITLGTNFTNAGFTSVTSTGTGDSITVQGATLTGQLFSNTGAATGSGTLTLNTAGGTVTVKNFARVIGNGSTDTLSLDGTGTANMNISLKAGSSVINLNTFASTIVLSGASTFTGNNALETITLGSGAAQTITGGGGNDVVTLGGNTSNATVTVGLTGTTVNTGTLSVVGSSTAIDAVTISGAGTYATTGVNTVTMTAAGSTLSGDSIINNTAGMNVSYTYTLAAGDTGSFTFGAVDALGTGGTIVLTANAVGSDVITLNNGDWFGAATESANVSIIANGGQNTINLSGSNYSSEHIGVSLAALGSSTNTSNGFVLTNFNIGSGSDTINFYGSTLTSSSGNATAVLNQNYVDSSGNNNTNTYTNGTTFVTGTSTLLTGSLANLTSSIGGAANSNGLIFDAVDSGSLIGTADFTLQSGINMAVSYITTNIGESGTGSTQKAIIAVHDGVAGGADTALFLFTSDGISGIVASELKLIGTLNSGAVNLSASNFS